MRLLLVSAVFICVGWAPALASPTLSAEKRQQAREAYAAGALKYDIGKYDEAVVEFEKAYEISANPAILYNIAQAHQQARNYEKAIQAYKSYLNRTGSPPNRAAVEARVAKLSELLEKQRQENAAPLNGGEKPPAEKIVIVREIVHDSSSHLPKPRPAFRYAGIALAAIGVGAIAGGAAMSALTVHESNSVQSAAATHDQAFGSALHSRQTSGQLYQTVQIPLYLVGGAALATGAALLGLGYRKVGGDVGLAPVVAPGTVGLSWARSF